MRYGFAAALVSALCGFCPAEVLKIVVNDTIHPITDEYIGRALAEAQQHHDDALLIELNTPGGLLDSTREIMQKILASPVPVIIYVTPSGSRAASAGFFILESADVAAMSPGTNTGAAHPVSLGGGKMDDVMKEKIENDASALMRSVVAKRGRNVEVAESTVRQSKSFTEQEALSQKLIDYVASNEQDLFKQMAGKQVKRFNGQTVTLNLEGASVRPFDMTLKQHILAYILNPNVAFILLAIGALALYAEFNHPGAVVPGNGWSRFHSAGDFCVEFVAYPVCSSCIDPCVVCAFRTGGKIRDSRSTRLGRNHDIDPRRSASGRRPDSRNAGASLDRACRQHPSRNHHRISNEHRPKGKGQ